MKELITHGMFKARERRREQEREYRRTEAEWQEIKESNNRAITYAVIGGIIFLTLIKILL